ncbi:two-component response regulator, fragment [Arthrospira platensis NIES-39]|nr:two-component response regulator, fragment [Arthrospira platensis NIES-39]
MALVCPIETIRGQGYRFKLNPEAPSSSEGSLG